MIDPHEPALGPEGEEITTDDWHAFRDECKRSLFFTSKVLCGYVQTKPEVHLSGCRFMEDDSIRNKCLLMPRLHRKTTVYTKAGIIHEIIRNPNIRILLGNEKAENAEALLGEVKSHFQDNPRLRYFFPELIPQNFRKTTWSSKQILVPREAGWSEPTVDTIGVGGTKVSQHYDLLHLDDIIGLAALESKTIMKDTIRWLNYTRGLKVDFHTTRTNLIGTRWDFKDVYAHAIDNLKFAEFRRGPLVIGDNGEVEPFFPEVISLEDLQEIMVTDPFQWATNFMNNPYDASTSDLRPEWLNGQEFWFAPDGDIRYKGPDGSIEYQRYDDLTFYLHVDPSMGETDDSTETAFVLAGLNKKGYVFLIQAWKKRIDPVKTLDQIFEYQESFWPRKTTIEAVAYQKALQYFAEDRARKERRYLNVEPFKPSTRRSKNARILYTLQPYFRDHRIFWQRSQFQFRDEYNAFGRDIPDILDALAQGPSVWKFPADQHTIQRRQRKLRSYESRGATGYGI
jgi:hypothetical protein